MMSSVYLDNIIFKGREGMLAHLKQMGMVCISQFLFWILGYAFVSISVDIFYAISNKYSSPY